jgi:hypothetical protein
MLDFLVVRLKGAMQRLEVLWLLHTRLDAFNLLIEIISSFNWPLSSMDLRSKLS